MGTGTPGERDGDVICSGRRTSKGRKTCRVDRREMMMNDDVGPTQTAMFGCVCVSTVAPGR